LYTQLSDIHINLWKYKECLKEIADSYQTENILVTMGDDFAYYKANETFLFVEAFKDALGDEFDFIYSTPSKYMAAIRAEGLEFPVYRGDFLPLMMQHPSHYWSGFFTSRPGFKKALRDASYSSFVSLT
jgi:hypothetical protein